MASRKKRKNNSCDTFGLTLPYDELENVYTNCFENQLPYRYEIGTNRDFGENEYTNDFSSSCDFESRNCYNRFTEEHSQKKMQSIIEENWLNTIQIMNVDVGNDEDLEDDIDVENNVENKGVDEKSLFYGCLLTSQESVLLQLRFAMTHNLTKAARQDLLELISLHCPTPNNCCTTIYRSNLMVKNGKEEIQKHFYCSMCHSSCTSAQKTCERCESELKKKEYFVYLSIENQLKRIAKCK